jgi:hypothetical protein
MCFTCTVESMVCVCSLGLETDRSECDKKRSAVKQVTVNYSKIRLTLRNSEQIREVSRQYVRAVGKRFIVHLSNRLGGPNLLN